MGYGGSSVLLAVLLSCGFACGDDEPGTQGDPPMIAGPYAEVPALGEELHRQPPPSVDGVSLEAPVFFYWHLPSGAGRLDWEVRAEVAGALSQGTVVHAESLAAEGKTHGTIAFRPQRLSRGGARRNASGRLEWVEGLYSVTAKNGEQEIGNVLFQVR